MLNFLLLAWTSVRMNMLKTILDTSMLFLSRLYSASLSWFSHSLKVVATGPKLTHVIHLTARALVAACFPIVQQRSRDVVEPRQNVKLKCTISVIHQPWRKVHRVIWHVSTAMVWDSWPTAKSMLEFNLSSHHLMTISWQSSHSKTVETKAGRCLRCRSNDQMIKWCQKSACPYHIYPGVPLSGVWWNGRHNMTLKWLLPFSGQDSGC